MAMTPQQVAWRDWLAQRDPSAATAYESHFVTPAAPPAPSPAPASTPALSAPAPSPVAAPALAPAQPATGYGGEVGDQIRDLYSKYLGRVPSASEVDYYYNSIVQHGNTPEGVAAAMQSSPEYLQRTSSPAPAPAPAFAAAPYDVKDVERVAALTPGNEYYFIPGVNDLASKLSNAENIARLTGASPEEVLLSTTGKTKEQWQEIENQFFGGNVPLEESALVKPTAQSPGSLVGQQFSTPTPAPTASLPYEPQLPFTQPGGGTVYPNTLPTAAGEQLTYFPTAWWTSSPSASSAYGLRLPSTARDFDAEMATYRQRYAPQFYLPQAPRDPLRSVSTPPPIAARNGYVWQWDESQGKWVEQPVAAPAAAPATSPPPDLSYAARGGAVSDLWEKYHG